MGVDHIGAGQLRQELDRSARAQRRQARATLQNASIGRAGIRVYDGGWIRIEDGGLSVTGTQTVTGRLEGSGTFDWSGPMDITGDQNVNGDVTFSGQVTVNGPWDLNGNGDIAGNVSLTGDMAVKSGGEIRVQGGGGDVVLSSTYSSPRINLGGAQIDGGPSLTFTTSTTTVYFTGGTIRIAGMPTRTGTGLPAGCVGADPDGTLWRAV